MNTKILGILLTAALVAGACTRTRPDYEFEVIKYTFSTPGTKVMSGEDFAKAGNKMNVYDVFVTNDNKTVNYINGAPVTNPGGDGAIWTYDNNDKYYWIEGTHNFWGYSTFDKKSEESFSNLFGGAPAIDMATRTLNIPATAMTFGSPQFDFVYSAPTSRVIESGVSNVAPVQLECAHMFAAFGITVTNELPDASVKVKRVYMQNLKNKNSAAVRFDGTKPQVALGTASAEYLNPETKSTFADVTPNITLASATSTNVSNGANSCPDIFNTSATAPGYYLIWPQGDLTPSQKPTVDDEGNPVYNINDALIVVEYEIEGVTMKRAVAFPKASEGLQAGMLYNYVISFSDKLMYVTAKVRPWDFYEHEMNYGSTTIAIADTENDKLTLDEATCNYVESEHTAYYSPEKGSVTFRFKLSKPDTGIWMASLTGDFAAFEFDGPNSGPTDQQAVIKLKPTVSNPDTPYTVQLKLSVRMPDGRLADADPVLQPNAYQETGAWKYSIKITK